MKQESTKAKAKTVNIAVAVFYIVIIFAIAFCLVSREVSLYEKSSEVSRLESRLEQAQTDAKQAKIAAESAIDLKKIEEVATTKFGMSRPEKNQTAYINIQQGDYVEKGGQERCRARNSAEYSKWAEKSFWYIWRTVSLYMIVENNR